MRLEGKVSIITGAASGIGEAIAKIFVQEGAKVVLADLNQDKAAAMAAALGADKAMAVKTDITDEASVKAMVDQALAKFGRIDVLVNNAGARIIAKFTEHSLADWKKMLDINLTGPFVCSKAVLPHMLEQKTGSIIHLASIASYMGRPDRAAYVAAKTGVLGLTRAMAVDLRGTGVRVNAIAPGMIATPFNAMFSENKETGPQWAKENSIGRWGQPTDIAYAAVYLASDEAAYVCGSDLKVDGGWLAAKARAGELDVA